MVPFTDVLCLLRRSSWDTVKANLTPEVHAALSDYVLAFGSRQTADDECDDHEARYPNTSDMTLLRAHWAEDSRLRRICTAKLVVQLKAFRALNIAMYGNDPERWEEDPATTAEYDEYIDSDGEVYED